jgi:hypothetical protein
LCRAFAAAARARAAYRFNGLTGPQIPIEPAEHLADHLAAWKVAVAGIEDHVEFGVGRRAEPLEHRFLCRFRREDVVVIAAHHQDRYGHARDVASLALESASPRLRGLLSGLLQEGYAMGNLLAALAFRTLYPWFNTLYPGDGWRLMFRRSRSS